MAAQIFDKDIEENVSRHQSSSVHQMETFQQDHIQYQTEQMEQPIVPVGVEEEAVDGVLKKLGACDSIQAVEILCYSSLQVNT